MKSFCELRTISENYNSLIFGKEWLGNGASKECYSYTDDLVIKVPKKTSEDAEFGTTIPNDEVALSERLNEFGEHGVGWAYGQFITELFVWNKVVQSNNEKLINCFVPIVDAFLDADGVPVIIQAKASQKWDYSNEDQVEETVNERGYAYKNLKGTAELLNILKENKHIVCVNDIRDSNVGYYNNTLAILDFGISSYSMDDFDDYGWSSSEDYNSDYNSSDSNETNSKNDEGSWE